MIPQVLRLILKDGLVLASLGVGIGLAGGFGLTRLMSSLLFEVKPTDALTFITVSALLTFVALLACLIPRTQDGSIFQAFPEGEGFRKKN